MVAEFGIIWYHDRALCLTKQQEGRCIVIMIDIVLHALVATITTTLIKGKHPQFGHTKNDIDIKYYSCENMNVWSFYALLWIQK